MAVLPPVTSLASLASLAPLASLASRASLASVPSMSSVSSVAGSMSRHSLSSSVHLGRFQLRRNSSMVATRTS